MSGKRIPTVLCFVVLGVALFRPAPIQAQEPGQSIHIKSSLGVEYFSRTIVWDEGLYSSKLKAAIGVLRAELELQKGFTIGAFAGYTLSNFNGLVFRQLPFSIDYEAGNIGGLLWGADVDTILFVVGDYEIGATAQFAMSLRSTAEFEILSLNQKGDLVAKRKWNRVLGGPVIRYTGYEDFTPFLSIAYNRLWGTFALSETIVDLEGTEEKTITGKGIVGITVGTVYEPSALFKLKAEVTALPYTKIGGGLDVDYGASVKVVVFF